MYQSSPEMRGSTASVSLPAKGFTSSAVVALIVVRNFSASVSISGPTTRYFGVTLIRSPVMPVCDRIARRAAETLASPIATGEAARLPCEAWNRATPSLIAGLASRSAARARVLGLGGGPAQLAS